MPEWLGYVRAHLPPLGVCPERELEIAAELAQQIESAYQAALASGATEAEARRRAEREIADWPVLARAIAAAEAPVAGRVRLPGGRLLADLLADIRWALRQWPRSLGFILMAVLSLALGIGANTAIFTLVDSVLLRPLPYPQPGRLARIGYDNSATDSGFFPKGWIRALGEHSASFASISGYGPNAESNVGGVASSERVASAEVMVNALDTLGMHPVYGRFFSEGDARAGGEPVVVLSYGYWRQHYASTGAIAGAIGRTLRVDGVSRRIVGVMPAGVAFPYPDTQLLTPVTFKGGDALDPWGDFEIRAFGRLNPGVTPLEAQAELRRLQPGLLPMFPWRMPDIWGRDMTAVPLLESQVGPMRPRLILLFGVVGLVLLIACANVANLMLARAVGREREIAIRSVVGASGTRLVRQLLVESVVLGVAAGAVGLAVAEAGLRALLALLPADTPRLGGVTLGWPVLVFTAVLSVVAGVLFGLVPALRMASPNLREALHAGSGVAGKARHFRIAKTLVMGQIALSVVVMVMAGLMLHSLWNLSRVELGFQTGGIVTAEVPMAAGACSGAATSGHCQDFFNTLLGRVRALPGVTDAALTNSLPLVGPQGTFNFDAQGHPREARQAAIEATRRIISPGYFGALGIPLLRGRLLDQQDASGASHAAIVSQSLAQRLWPHEDPLGLHILNVVDETAPAVWNGTKALAVVGVVGNAREGNLAAGYGDDVYVPMTAANEQPTMYVVLRTRAGAAEAAAGLRQSVAAIDPSVPVTRVRALNQVVAASVAAPRSLAMLLLAFGGLAVMIGGVGVFSLIAQAVTWRTREFGIRLALGARRWQIVGGVVRQGLGLALGGSAAGLVAAALAARLMRRFLFGVSPVDPAVFAAAALLMMLLAMAAAWYPAQRAAGVDPMTTLRQE